MKSMCVYEFMLSTYIAPDPYEKIPLMFVFMNLRYDYQLTYSTEKV